MLSRLKPFIPIFLLIFILLTISSEARRRDKSSFLNSALSIIISPVEQVITASAHKVENFWFDYFYLIQTRKQNQEMAKLIERQKKHLTSLMEESQSNQRLKNLLNLSDEHKNLEVTGARVVAWDPGPWFNSLVIGAGSSKFIGQDQAVIHSQGVVGRIAKVAPYYAKVLLVTDYNSSIDAVVQRSRVRGLVSGQGANPCSLKYVLRDADVRVGDLVITSGLDGIFPPGVPLGTIVRADRKSADKFLEVDISPAVNFTSLEEVLVVTKAPGRPQAWPDEEIYGPWPKATNVNNHVPVVPEGQ